MRRRRFNRFEELFPEAIDLLARAVRSSHAFTTGFEMIGTEMPDPLGEEFRLTYQQQKLGMPLREALQNLIIRMPLPDVRIFVSAIQIQRESGGNLGEILDTLSAVIRERFKLVRQVRTHTAEGRLSMYVLTAIPVVTAAILIVAKPEYMKVMFIDPRGQAALAVAVGLQIVGYFVIGRIIKIKV
jgi:tight adherence protein B